MLFTLWRSLKNRERVEMWAQQIFVFSSSLQYEWRSACLFTSVCKTSNYLYRASLSTSCNMLFTKFQVCKKKPGTVILTWGNANMSLDLLLSCFEEAVQAFSLTYRYLKNFVQKRVIMHTINYQKKTLQVFTYIFMSLS